MKAVEDGAEVAEDALLQNLYGSSHSYLMDLNFFKGLVNKEEDKVKRGISDVH